MTTLIVTSKIDAFLDLAILRNQGVKKVEIVNRILRKNQTESFWKMIEESPVYRREGDFIFIG